MGLMAVRSLLPQPNPLPINLGIQLQPMLSITVLLQLQMSVLRLASVLRAFCCTPTDCHCSLEPFQLYRSLLQLEASCNTFA